MSKKNSLHLGRSVLLAALAAYFSSSLVKKAKSGEPIYLSDAAPAMTGWLVAILSWVGGKRRPATPPSDRSGDVPDRSGT